METCPWPTPLYDAVVRHDVAGFVGARRPAAQRDPRRLGIVVEAEDLDTLAGWSAAPARSTTTRSCGCAGPTRNETLEQLAQRLGCSLSTVKRHLRRERHERPARTAARPMPPRSCR